MSSATMSPATVDDFHPGQLVMVGMRGRVLDDTQAAFLRRHRIRAVVLALAVVAAGNRLVYLW